MSNYQKAFNFKAGVQVDVDNFVVNSLGNVGIGTSVPTQPLDVYGTARVSGITTTNDLFVSGGSNFTGVVTAGVVTATEYYGDGSKLDNIVGYSTTAWIQHQPIGGSGNVGLSTTNKVGIGTTIAVNSYDLVIGTGISFSGDEGNIDANGVITSSGGFIGTIRASDINGTINDSILPDSITSNLVGTADTATVALGLKNTPDISVGIITTSDLKGVIGTVGVLTVTDGLVISAGASLAIGNSIADPESNIHIQNSGNSEIKVISHTGDAIISLGNTSAVGIGSSLASIKYGVQDGTLDIYNYDTGDIRMILDTDPSSGINTGSFSWYLGNTSGTPLMNLSRDGKLGINKTSPEQLLHVGGGLTATEASYFGNGLNVNGTVTATTFVGDVTLPNPAEININAVAGVSTLGQLHVYNKPAGIGHSIGIGTDLPKVALDARQVSGNFGRIAISTERGDDNIGETNGFFSEHHIFDCDNFATFKSIGIGTTNAPNNAIILTDSFLRLQDPGGSIFVENGNIVLGMTTGGEYTHTNAALSAKIGIHTTQPRSVFDMGRIGDSATYCPLILPSVTNAQMNNIESIHNDSSDPVPGSIVFCTDGSNANKFMGWNGSSWVVLG